MIKPGMYRDAEGRLVSVTRTATGLLVTHADGTVTAVAAPRG